MEITTDSIQTMGQVELRAACKEVGIKKYGKLSNGPMRVALDTHLRAVAKAAAPVVVAPAPKAAPAAAVPTAPAPAPAAARGIKVEKNREERNGFVRPSAGGICRAMWDLVEDSINAGKLLTIKEYKEVCDARGYNWNNASAEYYKARQFRGITGRPKK